MVIAINISSLTAIAFDRPPKAERALHVKNKTAAGRRGQGGRDGRADKSGIPHGSRVEHLRSLMKSSSSVLETDSPHKCITIASAISSVRAVGLQREGHAEHYQVPSSSVVQTQGPVTNHVLANARHDFVVHHDVAEANTRTMAELINEPGHFQLSVDRSDAASCNKLVNEIAILQAFLAQVPLIDARCNPKIVEYFHSKKWSHLLKGTG